MKVTLKSIFFNIYAKNLIIAAVLFIILCFAALKWLDDYTQHGDSVEIPDVKGLTVELAEPVFAGRNLVYQVIDSAFHKNFPPGGIIETIPSAGAKVKKGRTIFLRINSKDAQLTSIPDVEGSSQRQALAILHSLGFEKITVGLVPGQFRDLVVGIEIDGRKIQSGEKAPLDIPITLLVSSGLGEPDIIGIINDTVVNTEHGEGENWY
ncbi:MAG: PASTA domain-containing protein [Dysgonamonadaceae bacterium]|jgi:beta-lactam-binding protein with PASTA domain|nr:PASTA domain-containing protein [Dysgonamonadaceae bacterium]